MARRCISRPHHRRNLASLSVLAALACGASHGGTACADVLHNQRSIALDGQWNDGHSALIGGQGFFGQPFDIQSADDFPLASPSVITRVTIDFGTVFAVHSEAAPAGGFLIEIFPDAGNRPAAAPAYSATSSSFQFLGSFPAGTNGDFNISPDHRHTWAIDLPGQGAALAAGTWWLAVQAVDLSPFGDYYFNPTRALNDNTIGLLRGSPVHYRDGSAAHGNTYGGCCGPGAINWHATPPSDMSLSIEGVPASPPCLTDVDDDGAVAPADIAMFVTVWFNSLIGGTLEGDFDGSGAVQPADVAAFVSTWLSELAAGQCR